MTLTPLDWLPIAAIMLLMLGGLWLSRGRTRSVADFLAAGRTAGRYLVSVAGGAAALGAITIIGNLEMNYVAGFSMIWWSLSMSVVLLIIHLSGWVLYRFRQTRCLTLAEFFERRYGRSFRVFAGLIAFLSGIVNFGIFPAVGVRFFLSYCGIPAELSLLGVTVPAFPLVMALLLGVALVFVYLGGQVVVIVTNFVQGVFINVVFVALCAYLIVEAISWDQIFGALAAAPEQASLINPFRTSHVRDFNFWYFLIGVYGVIYGQMSWQGTQAYNASARSAHEAKMGQALALWKSMPQGLFLVFAAVVIYAVLHHPDFVPLAREVDQTLAGIDREAIRSQLRAPLVLQQLLPPGLLGAFAAVMLACFLSTQESYAHSWGSIFVQDVLLPLRRGRPLSPRAHLRALRLAILGVTVFVLFFSLLFQQSQYIFLFFAITGAIFAGGSGAVIIGGLYWRRGTGAAAWAALATGAVVSVGGIVLQQNDPAFPINGQVFWAIAMAASTVVYALVSLLGRQPREPVDLDRLLHRGRWAAEGDHMRATMPLPRGHRLLLFTEEFTRGDKALYLMTQAWTLGWFAVFVAGTVINLTRSVGDAAWISFWKVFLLIQFAASGIVVVWFTWGGVRDLRDMFARLRRQERSTADDGVVR
ncbi:MAG: sodium:solute symporter [Candidatus Krumholzibacteria bacterium]|nr:sodium:solute symporter [Candidatus Krumholzibacteria bacterium]